MRGNAEAISFDEQLTVRESIIKESGLQNGKIHYPLTGNGHGNGNGNGNGKLNGHSKITKFHILSRKSYSGKRTVDLLLSGVGLIAFLLIYPFVALGIKLSSRGPVIYKQIRTGKNGHHFTCYKFRTMDCFKKRMPDNKPDITQKGDPRVFGFGKLLRQLNLDELPQILNVLKGDMSLVGPRPYPVKECSYWNSTFTDFYYRYAVKPGISGLAQSKGYRGGTLDVDHMRKRLDYDLIYVQKGSFRLDLKIIGHTMLQMIHLNTKAH